MAIQKISIKKGEAKTLKFTFKESGAAKDMTGATFTFVVKTAKSVASYLIEKLDASFNKTEIASGIVKVTLSKTDLAVSPGVYISEIRAYFSDQAIDLSEDIVFRVETPVYHAA